jgi:3-oxoacyl-(acyl-carrier-protein) synthase
MEALNSVYLGAPALYCAAGSGTDALWQAMLTGGPRPQSLDVASNAWPQHCAFLVDEPDLRPYGIDRKVLRTMEKQTRLALHGAGLSMARIGDQVRRDDRFGLYLGLPTVDEEVPSWSALQGLRGRPDDAALAELFLRETPPFAGLSLLNSSACAHISATFGLTGAMAVFSPSDDAGLQALIEGALSLAEGENDYALIGSVSPKAHPLRLLQQASSEKPSLCPGEGTAFLVLRREAPEGPAVQIAGYARAFAASHEQRQAVSGEVISRALAMAGISDSAIDWILTDSAAFDASPADGLRAPVPGFSAPWVDVPMCNCESVTGAMGPAQALTQVLMALHGLQLGRRLRPMPEASGWREEAADMRHALVTVGGPHGQFIALVLRRKNP